MRAHCFVTSYKVKAYTIKAINSTKPTRRDYCKNRWNSNIVIY